MANWTFYALPIAALVLGSAAFLRTLLLSRAFDERYGIKSHRTPFRRIFLQGIPSDIEKKYSINQSGIEVMRNAAKRDDIDQIRDVLEKISGTGRQRPSGK